jgi:alginate O-acetyltransferase complex protein AlgI
MVFSSITFLFFFLPIAFAVAVVLPVRWRNLWLLGCSWFFYMWGSGALVLLLVISTAVDYCFGLLVARGRAQNSRGTVRFAVAGSVALNLSLLGYFKYANFLVEQLNSLGFGAIAQTSVTLPIGISFFTFQSMSYTIDVARGRADHLRNPIDFALYVSLFPQLVAGPIVRFHELSAQLTHRKITVEGVSDGMVRFTHGLAKKVIVADTIAPIADAAFGNAGSLSTPAAWIGVLAYSMQIYFDFSGYSDMAIGLGQMLGFTFPENFRRPYSAVSITDFWRRWHITLSSWFRDYLYVPLGGNRGGTMRTYLNLSVVFLLTGLWHGANWTFVVWGLFHGTLLIIERATGQRPTSQDVRLVAARRAGVFVAVLIGWVFFRAADLSEAGSFLGDMFAGGLGETSDRFFDASISTRSQIVLLAALASVALPARFCTGPELTAAASNRGQMLRLTYLTVVLPLCIALVATSTFSPFLYFQF